MTEAQAATLQKLAEHNAPCFLWDSDRLRIVWANEAGLRLFGAETLFDLIDKQFDVSEAGAASIRTAKRDLAPQEIRKQVLKFPSAGSSAEFSALCSLYRLDDGRQGVLAVGEAASDAAADIEAREIADAFLALPNAALVVEADGRIAHRNAAALEFLAHLSEQTLAGFLGEEAAAHDFALRVSRAGTVSEVRSANTGLGARDIRFSARRLARASEAPQRFVLMLEDVTERRALERSLTKANSPLAASKTAASSAAPAAASAKSDAGEVPLIVRSKLDAMREAIIITRGQELLYANQQALGLFKISTIAALKERADIVKGIVSEQGHVVVADGAGDELSVEVQRSGIPWNKGEAIQAKLVVRAREAAVQEAVIPPKPEEVLPIVTAAPQGEQISWKPDDAELGAILDTASDGIITLDAEGQIRSFSAGAEAIFGRPKAMVLGQPFADLLTAETGKVFRDYLAALTDSGLAAVFNDGREVSANVGPGRSLPLFLTISRLHLEAKSSQTRQAFCAVVRDITQWKQTEAELRDAKEKAEQTSRQKSEFLARISHELRTPLNAILGFSEVMRLERFGKLQNEKYRDYVSDIYSSGAHLLSLINDLLDLSKVEAGKLELNFTSVSLPEVTEHAMRLLAERAQQARVSMRRNFPGDLPNVVADLRSTRQIMINLLSNAIKFTDPGGQVMITGRVNKAGELALRVKDTGVGMSEDELKGALEPFQRVISATRPDIEGTGLGLPLTKALTEANRASFSISSEPGKGTLVEIIYPTTRVLAD
ncbi:MAG TPA: ATP-binding protein [Aestuariivirgaceae bacterium]|nr:ATP-binding protein [Aestuariivirgaceae bacterium]